MSSTLASARNVAARASSIRPIEEVGAEAGLLPLEFDLYGRYKAKINLHALDRLTRQPRGKYIDVTAITPTPLGEGKIVTAIGLGQGLRAIGARAMTCLREPSLGAWCRSHPSVR